MADEDLDLDIAIELERLRHKDQQQEDDVMQTVADPFRGVNKGVALGLGFPVDLMNSAASLVGVDVEEPVLGSAWISRQMNKLGVGTEAVNSPGVARVGESVGAALAPLGVMGQAAKSVRQLSQASGPVAAAGREILDTFRRNPRAVAGAEVGTAAAGGTGAAVAQQVAPGSPGAEIAGEIAGGLTPAAIAHGPAAIAIRSLRNQTTPLFTKKGRKRSAGTALKEIIEDPEAVAKVVDTPSQFPAEASLNVAQETGDRGLMTLERAAVSSSAANERTYADMADVTRTAMEQAVEDIAGPGQPLAPRAVLDAQVNRLEELLDARIANAQQAARNSIDDMGGTNVTARRTANNIVRGKLEEALADARIQEAELWGSVPGKIQAPTAATRAEYARLVGQRAETADPKDIPDFVHEWLSPQDGKAKIGDSASVNDLRTLRSRMLAETRAERAKKGAANRTKVGFLQQLQGSVLDDLSVLPDDSLQRAREFSEILNSKFFKSPIGRLLAHERAGGVDVDPELTLERTIAKKGPEAGTNADALLRATDDAPEVREAIGTHIQQRFMQGATEQGAVVPRRAEAFLNNNAQLLERFPEVRQQLEEALMTQGNVADVTAATRVERAVMHDKNRSVAALYLGTKPSREINAVLEAAPDKPAALKELWARMQGDPGGQAGLKAAFVREMFGRAQMSKLDADGIPGIDPKKLRRDFKKDAAAAQEAGWFSAGEMGRLDKVIDVLQRIDGNLAKGRRLEDIVDLPFGAGIVDLGVRLTAAVVGGKTPMAEMGPQLVAANAAVRAARRITAKMPTEKVRTMVADAVFNRELFQDLMKAAGTPEEAARVNRRLNAWLINLGVDRDEEDQ